VARVLIVGCGCRGRELAAALREDGHAVRGTTRSAETLAELDAAGVEGVVADPDRLGTIMAQLAGVAAVCWLMGSAGGDVNGPRLETFVERLVDTPVRGIVYEAAGGAAGAQVVAAAEERWRMPSEIVDVDPADHEAWLSAMHAAVKRLL
jgi:nucleoside-diphosphate-sugar epimerase